MAALNSHVDSQSVPLKAEYNAFISNETPHRYEVTRVNDEGKVVHDEISAGMAREVAGAETAETPSTNSQHHAATPAGPSHCDKEPSSRPIARPMKRMNAAIPIRFDDGAVSEEENSQVSEFIEYELQETVRPLDFDPQLKKKRQRRM